MGLREDLQRKIIRKRAEIDDLKGQVRAGEAYVQALEDTLKMLPREMVVQSAISGNGSASGLRKNSETGRAYRVLQKAGTPMHITDILGAMGKAINRQNRAGLASSLSAYARRGEIFTRPAPNTFALIGGAEQDTLFAEGRNEPPGE